MLQLNGAKIQNKKIYIIQVKLFAHTPGNQRDEPKEVLPIKKRV